MPFAEYFRKCWYSNLQWFQRSTDNCGKIHVRIILGHPIGWNSRHVTCMIGISGAFRLACRGGKTKYRCKIFAKDLFFKIFSGAKVLFFFTAKVPYQFARAHVLHAPQHLFAIDICSRNLTIVPIFISLGQNFPKSEDSHIARALHVHSALQHHLLTFAIDICSRKLIIVPIFTSLLGQSFPKSEDPQPTRTLHVNYAPQQPMSCTIE